MSNDYEQYEQSITSLEAENQRLRAACQDLENMQKTLEQAVSDNNCQLLQAEMSSMELEQIFHACTDAMWVVREDGVVVRANNAMLALLGKTQEEVIGTICSALIEYQKCDSGVCPLTSGKGLESCQEIDIQMTTAAEEHRHFILSTAPLLTLDGSSGFVGQFKDITDRKKAEEELERANRALEQMARVDGLTQVANRRCFDETLAGEWRRLAREQKPFALILGDIDFFKKYNDSYGHQEGDECLRRVAQALKNSVLRPADLVARYGGEEFALLLPGIDSRGALRVAQRALQAVREQQIQHRASTVAPHVTVSLGAACMYPHQVDSPEKLVAQADQALYRAKETGRNRVMVE
ncbi:MAG: diguanylate cyclase [Desulfuromonadaceae bacterium]